MNRSNIGCRTLVRYGLLGLLGVVCLMSVFLLVAYYRSTRPQVCCSCLCQNSKGDWCSGSVSQGAAADGCAKICQDACESRECQLKQGSVINEGKCRGGLIPFL